MTVYAEIWGGYSYAWGDREQYQSVSEVLADLNCETNREYGSRQARPCWGDWQPGDYAAYIYHSPDQDYPSKVVEVGPRGGLRVRDA